MESRDGEQKTSRTREQTREDEAQSQEGAEDILSFDSDASETLEPKLTN